MKALQFKSIALRDVQEIVSHYKLASHGLGAKFALEAFSALELALLFPEMHPQHPPGVYRIILRRFPYTIYHRTDAQALVAQAVLHGHMDPAARDQRLGDE